MFDKHGFRKHTVAAVIMIVVTAGTPSTEPACAPSTGWMQNESSADGPSPRLSTLTGIRFVYHTFTDSRMDECYGNAPYLMADFLVLGSHHGALFEIGYLYREGDPTPMPTDWNVISTSLSMWAVPVTVNYLYHITGYDRSHRFAPYVGLGIGTYIGGEKIGAIATTLLKKWDGWTWGIRGSMACNAVIGAHIRPWRGFDTVVEMRWIQGGRGGNIDMVDEEDEPKFDAYLYPLVQRSSYDFTGWSISVGIRW